MSDEKPFAVAVEDDDHDNVFQLWVGGHLAAVKSYESAIAVTAAINAAHEAVVEQRGANLRGAIQALHQRRLNDGLCWCFLWPDEQADAESVLARDGHGEQCLAARAALGPNPPDYVPASELYAEREKTRGTWGVLFDALYESGGEIHLAHLRLMEALGLKPPQGSPVELVERLRAQRGGKRPGRGYTAEFCRWEGEQAAFSMVLSALSGEASRSCKICGDPTDHGGRAHSETVGNPPQWSRPHAYEPQQNDSRCRCGMPMDATVHFV